MRVEHMVPAGWSDTDEADKIQPSAVAGLAHRVTLEVADIEALRGPAGVAPAGAVLYFAMAAAPAGWLVCDGALLARADYPALFTAIGVTFGAGDGATTFKLPDLRGEFVRGWDAGRGVDYFRTLGSAQPDEIRAHTHRGVPAVANGFVSDIGGNGARELSGVTASAGGKETRPRNVALLPCIATGA